MRILYVGLSALIVGSALYLAATWIPIIPKSASQEKYQVNSQIRELPTFDLAYLSEFRTPQTVTENGVSYLDFSSAVRQLRIRIAFSADHMKLGDTLTSFMPDYIAPSLPRHWIVVNGHSAFCQWLSEIAPVTVCVANIHDTLVLVSVFGHIDAATKDASTTAGVRSTELDMERSIRW